MNFDSHMSYIVGKVTLSADQWSDQCGYRSTHQAFRSTYDTPPNDLRLKSYDTKYFLANTSMAMGQHQYDHWSALRVAFPMIYDMWGPKFIQGVFTSEYNATSFYRDACKQRNRTTYLTVDKKINKGAKKLPSEGGYVHFNPFIYLSSSYPNW